MIRQGSTKAWPLCTLNGAHLPTDGSRTVRVPFVTMTATGDAVMPAEASARLDRERVEITIAPAFAWMTVAGIVPTASGWAMTSGEAPIDGAAMARPATSARPNT